MDKIASPEELTAEIRKLLAYAESKEPSREKLAKGLTALSERVADTSYKPEAWYVAQVRKLDHLNKELARVDRGMGPRSLVHDQLFQASLALDAAKQTLIDHAEAGYTTESRGLTALSERVTAKTAYTDSYVQKAIRTAIDDLNTAVGGLDYRLYDRSGRQMGGEILGDGDMLQGPDRKNAQKAYKDLEKAVELARDAARALQNVELHYR